MPTFTDWTALVWWGLHPGAGRSVPALYGVTHAEPVVAAARRAGVQAPALPVKVTLAVVDAA